MANTKNVYEVLNEVAQRNTKEDKIAVLRFNASKALKEVLRGAFDPRIKFVFESIPPYTPSDSPIGLGYSSLHNEIVRTYLFVKNHPRVSPGLPLKRKELILIQLLESLEAKEAEVYANMLMKDLKVEGLTYNLVKEAFPDILL